VAIFQPESTSSGRIELPRPIRLALVITELAPGGAERCLVQLATRLDRSRFCPIVYSLAPEPSPGRRELVDSLRAAGIEVAFLGHSSPRHVLAAVRRLAAHFQQQRPDVVQTFLFHANVVGALAARRAGVSSVVLGQRVADRRRWRAWLERWAGREAVRIVCVSQSVADHCRRLGYPAERLEVIPNGIDVAAFAGAEPLDLRDLGLPPGRRGIVCIGRLDPQKGLRSLLAAAPHFLRPLPNHDLILVGEGPERRSLERLALASGFGERIHLVGWRANIPALLAAADLLVLSSRWEGMPNVVLEAMAAGKAVVATRAEGVVELLGEQAEPQTVAVDDEAGLAARIAKLAGDASVRERLGRLNQARAASMFSLAAMVQQYACLYETLAQREESC
jgi:glycosyltransferase involved in cell wall biosynthesis